MNSYGLIEIIETETCNKEQKNLNVFYSPDPTTNFETTMLEFFDQLEEVLQAGLIFCYYILSNNLIGWNIRENSGFIDPELVQAR